MTRYNNTMAPRTLYRPELEHDACGVGFVAKIAGQPSFQILDTALRCVTNLTHRGAVDADAKTGDGGGRRPRPPGRGAPRPRLRPPRLRLAAGARGPLGLGRPGPDHPAPDR